MIAFTYALLLTTSVLDTRDAPARAHLRTPVAPTDYCPSTPTNEAAGIELTDVSNTGSKTTRNIVCDYKSDPNRPLPANQEFAFRIKCPVGYHLVFPGYDFHGSQNTSYTVTGFIPISGSSDDDAVDVLVRRTGPYARLELSVFALCR